MEEKEKFEEKEQQASVVEYDELEEQKEKRPVHRTPYEPEICNHMNRLFPNRVTRVYREFESEFLHLDVFVMKAPTKKDFHVIYTTGMSAMPMTLPEDFPPEYKGLERAELLLFLPAEWDILTGYETDKDVPDHLWWPVNLMKYLARFPHEYKTWLGWGHAIPNSEKYVPYDPSTKLCGAMLGALQEEISVLRTKDGTQINLYPILPLYKEEMDYKMKYGTEALLQKLSKLNGYGMIVFPDRPNVCADDEKDGE